MADDHDVVPVAFRVSDNDPDDIYALFPTIEASAGMVTCFEHVGQHGSADYALCLRRSRPAKPDEYASLKRELESAPYYYRLTLFYPGQRVRVVNGTGRVGVIRNRHNEHGFMVRFPTSRKLTFIRESELEPA